MFTKCASALNSKIVHKDITGSNVKDFLVNLTYSLFGSYEPEYYSIHGSWLNRAFFIGQCEINQTAITMLVTVSDNHVYFIDYLQNNFLNIYQIQSSLI